MRKLLMAFVAFALVASACGGDDDDGGVAAADSPLVGAIAEQMMEGADADSPIATQAEAECWAGRVVGNIGEDRLGELGVTVDNVGDIEDLDFTDGEVDTIVSSLGDCVDLKALMAEQMAGDLGEEAANCVAGELDDDFLNGLIGAAFRDEDPSGSDDFFQTMLDIAAECDLPLN